MMVVEKNCQSVESEAYRALKVKLQYLFKENQLKCIAVVSGNCNEGKSTICSNLAISFSQSNKKVLLMDCNLRKPVIHELFSLKNELGLSDVLLGNAELTDAIQKYNENVFVLSGGHTSINTPSEVLESITMTELLEVLKDSFDIIIIDTLCLKNFTDTQVLAAKVDGIVMVARAEKTSKNSILDTKEKLDEVGANILGIVLNGTKMTKKDENG